MGYVLPGGDGISTHILVVLGNSVSVALKRFGTMMKTESKTGFGTK